MIEWLNSRETELFFLIIFIRRANQILSLLFEPLHFFKTNSEERLTRSFGSNLTDL